MAVKEKSSSWIDEPHSKYLQTLLRFSFHGQLIFPFNHKNSRASALIHRQ